jgi:hypothetical protein
MYDFSDFLDDISLDKQVINVSSWVLVFAVLAAIFVTQKILSSKQALRFPFVIAALLSVGIPAVFGLVLDREVGRYQWRLTAFLSLYPDFVTNCLVVAACGEIIIALFKVGAKGSAIFNLVFAGIITFGLWAVSHARSFETVSLLVDFSFWLSLAAVVLAVIPSRFRRSERNHDYLVLNAGLVGVFLAANLLRFTPASNFTVNQIETVSIISAFVALLSMFGLWLLLEGNNIMPDQHLNKKLNSYE